MKIIFVGFLFFIMSGCFSADKQVATIEFHKINKFGHQFQIHFDSDVNLDILYQAESGESVVSRRLVCTLDGDVNFSVKHNLRYFFRGDLELQQSRAHSGVQISRYISTGNFFLSSDSGASKRVLESSELSDFLTLRSSIPCKVVMTVYLKQPYYSSIMSVPTATIIEVLN